MSIDLIKFYFLLTNKGMHNMTPITYEVTVFKDYTQWRLDGKLHRIDGPAVELSNGERYWYQNGLLHRTDGPAVENAKGDRYWYIHGQLHREDGHSVEFADGDKAWFFNDRLHRIDGPAVERIDGKQYWYLDGTKVTEDEHARRTKPAKELTVNDIEKLLGYRIKIVK